MGFVHSLKATWLLLFGTDSNLTLTEKVLFVSKWYDKSIDRLSLLGLMEVWLWFVKFYILILVVAGAQVSE